MYNEFQVHSIMLWTERVTLREKCPYSEFFWSLLSRIRREYVEIPLISLYSVPMRENKDQKNSQNLHHSRSYLIFILACFSNIDRKIKNQFPSFIFTNVSLRAPSWNLKITIFSEITKYFCVEPVKLLWHGFCQNPCLKKDAKATSH